MNLRNFIFSLGAVGILWASQGCTSNSSNANAGPSNAPSGNAASGSGDSLDAKGLTLGFAQVGAESGWRTANTNSIKDEAERRGVNLKFVDAQQKQENQIKAIRSYIAQGVDVIAFSPVVETGWELVLQEAKKNEIPVILSDRRAKVPDDLYATFIGSDFVKEGEMAGEWLAKETNGKATIAELAGTPGAAPANDRAKGFRNALAKNPNMKLVFTQTGDFNRAKGKEVAEALLKSPAGKSITAIYAHNDDMALGAIQAVEEAGKVPGKDIKIISIDGIKDAFQAMADGKLNATVECSPLLGNYIIDAAVKLKKGEKVEKWTVVKDRLYDMGSAKTELPNRKY